MAWNYRKRIKIFPGLHLNFSKRGVSTSIGPKGAKVSVGKKGTYLNTSIPGTGIYSRRRISNMHKENNDKNLSTNINGTSPSKEGFFKIKNTWGCCFRWLGLISIIFLIINLFQFFTGDFDNSENNRNALLFYGIIAALFIFVYIGRFMSFLKRKFKEKSTTNRIPDINEIVENDSIERTKEVLKKIIDQNDAVSKDGLSSFNRENSDLKEKSLEVQKVESESDPIEELESLIGLSEVKKEVSALADFVRIQQEREKKGLKSVGLSYHCVFTGNPGTGKTTVARILAEVYRDLGVLKKGHLVETDRSGLVAEYVGQTAVKTNKIIDSALDGVLFIDEAYSLVQGGSNDYGQEAISTLLKRMEDDRHRLIVVLAGYPDDMKQFIDSNPGLQSRFNRFIHFSDYSAVELKQIFLLNVEKNQYKIDENGLISLDLILNLATQQKDKNFGNGRFVRNLFEKTIQNQAIRLSNVHNVSKEELSLIIAEDLPVVTN